MLVGPFCGLGPAIWRSGTPACDPNWSLDRQNWTLAHLYRYFSTLNVLYNREDAPHAAGYHSDTITRRAAVLNLQMSDVDTATRLRALV